jgi:hypothetical protein
VSGGSNVWGFRLADSDTIPALLQAALHSNGHREITVYNFGIEDANMAKELALLRHFKDIYGIDQVIFLTGGADVLGEYFAIKGQPLGASPDRITSFELYRTIDRIRTTWFDPSPERLARIDQSLARVANTNRLTEGILAADNYCRAVALCCDFVLMPLLPARRPTVRTEIKLARTYARLYPRLQAMDSGHYAMRLRFFRLSSQSNNPVTHETGRSSPARNTIT